MKIVLIGYMGSGKSAVGIDLAVTLGYQFIDLDRHIELLEEASISEIFKEKGEIYFVVFFFFQAEDGIRDFCLSRGLGDV